ncbi:hypothetical protein EON68_00755, partial [archaeon]
MYPLSGSTPSSRTHTRAACASRCARCTPALCTAYGWVQAIADKAFGLLLLSAAAVIYAYYT